VNAFYQWLIRWLLFLALTRTAIAAEYFPPKPAPKATGTNAVPPARWHSITVQPPAGSPEIHFYNKINPVWWFGNADNPDPPEDYLPDKKFRRLKWRFRNSFHNFTFYVIGIADKTFVRSGRYPQHVFNPHGGWNIAVCKYKLVPLPFLAYRGGKWDAYFGWRNRGNFGVKFNVTSSYHEPGPDGAARHQP
jgi:hypothetical protein